MGHRILVAILAVLASLAAQIAPAQARACMRSPAEVGASQTLAGTPSFAESEAVPQDDAAGVTGPRVDVVPVPNERFVPQPAVRTGVDRALE